MTAPSVPRIRARKPKVRSGCATCKSRRIKCDEDRPICAHCKKSRLPCKYVALEPRHGQGSGDGSGDGSSSSSSSKNQYGAVPTSYDGNSERQLSPRLHLQEFEGHEVYYFDLFRNIVVSNLCQNGYENFWYRTVLRESLRDECVRDCVLGAGALCRAMMDQVHRLMRPGAKSLWMVPADSLNAMNTRYHQDALLFHTKAVSKFRRRMQLEGSSITPRTILIMSLLLIVFEAMQGNTETIDRLMQSTISALDSSTSSMVFGTRLPPNLDDEGIREADYLFTRLSGFNSLLSPFYPGVLKNKAYQRTWLCQDATPSPGQSTQEIRHSFERYTTYFMLWCFRTAQTKLFNSEMDFARFDEEQALALAHSRIWCEFLQAKVDEETKGPDPDQDRAWKIMLVEAKLFSIFAQYRHDPVESEVLWDSQLPVCREAVALVESALGEGSPLVESLPPLFEDKLQPMLRSLTNKCRHYGTRTRALALCQKLSGPWFENKAMVAGMRILVELEERHRDASGFIPYRSRLKWSTSSWNGDRTELRMVLVGVITGERREVTIRKDEDIAAMVANISKLSI
ncbi:uncharacterized protein F4812DRAFT_151796 [Daldinia caldariorum]|uniref:uncharacterized protein n=1 Tax=Daldinia caldariorum TaxID=326644 RepID=UPI0020076190|nr:uncharacterized protein F4812DRAFT_151796 [Daldinia caldariorum]KAI1464718.1 hypothetical protein F4812DRAFT_151796 [Daldinia caldariorum]